MAVPSGRSAISVANLPPIVPCVYYSRLYFSNLASALTTLTMLFGNKIILLPLAIIRQPIEAAILWNDTKR